MKQMLGTNIIYACNLLHTNIYMYTQTYCHGYNIVVVHTYQNMNWSFAVQFAIQIKCQLTTVMETKTNKIIQSFRKSHGIIRSKSHQLINGTKLNVELTPHEHTHTKQKHN